MLARLDCAGPRRGVVEFGCGYGTFTRAAAELVQGPVFVMDIDPSMTAATASRVASTGRRDIIVETRDFVSKGCGRPDASIDYVILFNILHIEGPVQLLSEAFRVLVPGGKVGIIHWLTDPNTPRGPSMSIRPSPDQCRAWAEQAGLEFERSESLDCCSWHFGLLMRRPGGSLAPSSHPAGACST